MFEDSLLESGKRFKRRSPWTTAISFALQILAVGVLLLIPLLYTEVLPPEPSMTYLVAPPPPPPPPPPAGPAPAKVQKVVTQMDNGRLLTPTAIPKKIEMAKEDEAPPSTGGVVGGVVGGVPGGVPGGVIGGILSGLASAPVEVPKAAPAQKIRVSSGVAQGLLIHPVQPQYPPLARQARIQGTVVLQAVIGKDGAVRNLHVVSGNQMLTQAALEAVKQWRYKPYYLNGEPVEVEFQINVNFTLTGG